jgi:Cu(I)/Ag(I) efflux system periplasmic protein CusF
MKHISKLALALVIGLASAVAAHAQDPHHGHGSAQGGKASAAMADGEVKKIDKSAGKITIKHGPLPRLEMTPMTMVFRVSDPKMLDQVQVGDKIRFDADKVNGALTVVKMEAAK